MQDDSGTLLSSWFLYQFCLFFQSKWILNKCCQPCHYNVRYCVNLITELRISFNAAIKKLTNSIRVPENILNFVLAAEGNGETYNMSRLKELFLTQVWDGLCRVSSTKRKSCSQFNLSLCSLCWLIRQFSHLSTLTVGRATNAGLLSFFSSWSRALSVTQACMLSSYC